MLTIGTLRHRLTLQTATLVPNTVNQLIPTWSDTTTGIPAKIETLVGSETQFANAQQAKVSHKITIRYRTTPTSTQRFKFGSRVFNIVAVRTIDERRFWIEIDCLEVV